MLKIGDFSRLGQVSVRTLHHYDQCGLLRPAEIDDRSGYRFYSVDQLPRLNRILALKDLGFSLDQIGRLVEGDVPAERLCGMLTLKQAEIEHQLTEGRARLARVEARLRQIEHEGEPPPYEVKLKRTPPLTVASARAVVPTVAEMPAYRGELYERVYGWLGRNGVRPSGPELAVYHNDGYVEEGVDMEAAAVARGSCGSAGAVCGMAHLLYDGPRGKQKASPRGQFYWRWSRCCAYAPVPATTHRRREIRANTLDNRGRQPRLCFRVNTLERVGCAERTRRVG